MKWYATILHTPEKKLNFFPAPYPSIDFFSYSSWMQSVPLCVFVGSAVGFRLDSLLKLSDTRARNNKMTLMHYLSKVTWYSLFLCRSHFSKFVPLHSIYYLGYRYGLNTTRQLKVFQLCNSSTIYYLVIVTICSRLLLYMAFLK